MAEEPEPQMVRAVLREHGYDVPDRGRISGEHMDTYLGLTNSGPAAASREAGAAGPGDYDGGVTAADFPGDDDVSRETSPGTGGERRPRRPQAAAKPGWREKLAGGAKAKAKGGRHSSARKRQPRVPVDRLCERGWELLSRVFTPVAPATGRCLRMQSPVAGLILEDVVAGTMADRILQPLARAEEKSKKVLALAGPPMIVAALEASQGLPDDQRLMREAILVPMLRECMVLWVDIAGDKVTEKARRDAEMGPVYEQVDELLAMIFSPPPPPQASVVDDEDQDQDAAAPDPGAGFDPRGGSHLVLS